MHLASIEMIDADSTYGHCSCTCTVLHQRLSMQVKIANAKGTNEWCAS